MVKVAVVGAGIIGLSSAVCIQKIDPAITVTLIADKFSPDTTGDGAAGLWGPYLLQNTPAERIERWSGKTYELCKDLWNSDDGGKLGITMMPCKRATKEKECKEPDWKNVVYGFRNLSKKELSVIGIPNLTFGYEYVTFTCEASKLLPELFRQFKENGGKVLKKHISDLNKLKDDFDIVVNCTGVYAHHVTPDQSVQPKRGQVMRVEAPEITCALIDDSGDSYVIPNQESVILGGTSQHGDWNLNPYQKDTDRIKNGCFKLYPSLKHAKNVRQWVGLRPGRPSVRLELEIRQIDRKPFHVVHNYGHGGSGVTLFWGCALETADIVKNVIMTTFIPSLPSKL